MAPDVMADEPPERTWSAPTTASAASARQPALVFLAAGRMQRGILAQLSRSPFAIIAVDRDADAPGFEFAAERIIASTQDAAAIEASLARLMPRFRIRGVLSGSHGDALVTAARLARSLSVPATDEPTVRTVNDKAAFLAACEALGCRVPRRHEARASDDVDWETLPYPLVMRPTRTVVGKAGIVKVRDAREASTRFREALERSASPRVELIEYVAGDDVVVVGAVGAQEPVIVALVDERNHFDAQGVLRSEGLRVPSRFAATPAAERVAAFAHELIRGLALRHTPFALALRLDPAGHPWPIEVHLQLGGDALYEGLLSVSSDTDVASLVASLAVCTRPTPPSLRFRPTRTARSASGTWHIQPERV